MQISHKKVLFCSVIASCLVIPSFADNKTNVKLDEIVVTATKTPIKVEEVPAAVDVITSDDIALKANTSNVFETLSAVPGVEVERGNMNDHIRIRGQEPSLLVNGRDMNFFTSLVTGSQVGISSIERVEIIKGPQAAIYGSKATSGVINIIRKKGDKDHPFV